ncbi:MAG: PIN domain nuclease [Planctomycetes bacterium]|nr:PIN domain nuclease [Planctomycetota bacterium]
MLLVDSAVWVDWFNGDSGPHVARLEQALSAGERIGIAPVIITEVLLGLADNREFEDGRAVLLSLPLMVLDGEGHAEAARLYRTLRRRGVTVRGAMDCIIAQTCLAADAELLSQDRDFKAIAKHSKLRICAV